MTECFCGSKVFTLNRKHKTAMCALCKLMWETNDEGDIIATLLPEAYARQFQPEPIEEISLLDMFFDESVSHAGNEIEP